MLILWLVFCASVHAQQVATDTTAVDIVPVEAVSAAVKPNDVVSETVVSEAVVSEAVVPDDLLASEVKPVEVGKHVTASMDAMSMIMSLLMVLVVIIISAMILKRFQGVRHSVNGLKIVTSLHLGAKEKLVVVQAGDKQLLLGVTPQQITLLETLDEPLVNSKENSVDFAQSLAKLLKQKALKTYDKQK